jgi:iron complex outermembrane receptor protein
VLVNGQRTAGLGLGNTQGGGNSVNIQSIPLAAVERVEILTDGASAVYGADAIAGVVNFILKKTETEGIVFGQYTKPQKDGGAAWTAGVSKGWGDLDKDKWNLTVTFSHDSQDEIRASQRSVSQRGAFFPVHAERRQLHFQRGHEQHRASQHSVVQRLSHRRQSGFGQALYLQSVL